MKPLAVTTTTTSGLSTPNSASTRTETLTSPDTASQASGEPGPIHCLIDFEATVHQGPSDGVALKGVLDFEVESTGGLYGQFLLQDQTTLEAAGQVDGRAINLIFGLGQGKYVFGTGTSLFPIDSDRCGGVLGGPFVGPEPGDMGDWVGGLKGAIPGSTPCCLPDIDDM
jgi:hypothetical protein